MDRTKVVTPEADSAADPTAAVIDIIRTAAGPISTTRIHDALITQGYLGDAVRSVWPRVRKRLSTDPRLTVTGRMFQWHGEQAQTSATLAAPATPQATPAKASRSSRGARTASPRTAVPESLAAEAAAGDKAATTTTGTRSSRASRTARGPATGPASPRTTGRPRRAAEDRLAELRRLPPAEALGRLLAGRLRAPEKEALAEAIRAGFSTADQQGTADHQGIANQQGTADQQGTTDQLGAAATQSTETQETTATQPPRTTKPTATQPAQPPSGPGTDAGQDQLAQAQRHIEELRSENARLEAMLRATYQEQVSFRAAQDRQLKIDVMRALAKLAGEVEELTIEGAEPAVVVERVRYVVEKYSLEPIGQAGEHVSFDPTRHSPLAGFPGTGSSVSVIRPGYMWHADGEDVLLTKAVVA